MSEIISISEAAKLVKKSEVTLYRHIKQGKLSRESNGKIQIAELIRCYGQLHVMTENLQNDSKVQQNESNVVSLLQQKIQDLDQIVKELKTDAKELRSEFLARENRLYALLENQQSKPENSAGGLFSRLFK